MAQVRLSESWSVPYSVRDIAFLRWCTRAANFPRWNIRSWIAGSTWLSANFNILFNQTLSVISQNFQYKHKISDAAKLFEFSRAFINSDICKFLYLSTGQFTFSEMFLIAFDKILLTFSEYFKPFSQNEAVVLVRETICSFSVFPNAAWSTLSSGKIKARKFK